MVDGPNARYVSNRIINDVADHTHGDTGDHACCPAAAWISVFCSTRYRRDRIAAEHVELRKQPQGAVLLRPGNDIRRSDTCSGCVLTLARWTADR